MRRADSDDTSGSSEDVYDSDYDDDGYFSGESTMNLEFMRERVNWENEEERREFFRRLCRLVKNWEGKLPDLRDIFHPEEIDWLLTEDAMKKRNKYLFIEFVIRSGYKDEPEIDEDGWPILRRTTALHHAARLKSRRVARDLFKIYKSYDANYIDENGLTHFHVACQFDFVGKVARFLVFGQNPDCPPLESDTSLVESPLLVALRNGSVETTELLLRAGADPNQPDIDGTTPMHIVCNSEFSCGDLAEILYKTSVEKNTPIEANARDESGRTPLHYALKQERVKEVAFLLSHGADPNIADDEGETPLHVIAKTSCDDNLMGRFFQMCDDNDLQLQINSKDNLDRTPLQWALRNLMAKSVGVLLDRGADLTSFDFPTQDYFDQQFLQREITLFNKFPIKLAADAMAIIEQLERKGYALSPTGALTIMNTFSEYGLFQDQNIVRSGLEYEKFAKEAKEHMIKADLSLYDLMQMQPEEAKQRLTYDDYTRFVDSNFEFPAKTGHVYVSRLSEMITRGFCRRWAMRSFLEVTRYKFSIPRCEELIGSRTNKDLYFMSMLINFILMSETLAVSN